MKKAIKNYFEMISYKIFKGLEKKYQQSPCTMTITPEGIFWGIIWFPFWISIKLISSPFRLLAKLLNKW